MIKNLISYIKNLHNKFLLFIIYFFLLTPFFINIILSYDLELSNPKSFLKISIFLITSLSFLAIFLVYYYNFFIQKKQNKEKFNQTNHLKKIFLSYIYIIMIFTNLFYMTQSIQNFTKTNTNNTQNFFNFNKNENFLEKNNLDLFFNSMYLSITNITTIGYGENISQHPYGRFLISIEAMIGQIMWGLSMTLWFVKKNND